MDLLKIKDELELKAFQIPSVIAIGIVDKSGTEIIEISVKEGLPENELSSLLKVIEQYQSLCHIEITNSNDFTPL